MWNLSSAEIERIDVDLIYDCGPLTSFPGATKSPGRGHTLQVGQPLFSPGQVDRGRPRKGILGCPEMM